jgi:hypothetical protein
VRVTWLTLRPNFLGKGPEPRFPAVARKSIRLARQVEVGEGAVDVRRHDLACRADVGFVELVVAGDAKQRQANADLVFEDLEQPHHAGGARRGEPVDIEPATGDRVGPQGQCFDDVGAAADPAIDDDASAAADRLDDLWQDVDRAHTLIELPPAMVRHIDAVDPVFDRDLGVLCGGDAFEDQRNAEALLDPLDVTPIELRLENAGVGDTHSLTLVAFGDVALADCSCRCRR